jgi:hypothetical protein
MENPESGNAASGALMDLFSARDATDLAVFVSLMFQQTDAKGGQL